MTGRVISLMVNGALLDTINTESAVAADYLGFMNGVITALARDKAALESEANKNGRTLATGLKGIGSISLESVGVPQVPNK
ncbi:hypothetical protein [Winslowiella arboricola]|uniref:hypothetical protein n=1 Tax=Winslowiella arboricola TaxID=2978220 RepID=UPI00225E3F53|nr:hypothetical protein [Winslowiella arboricola]MCU5775197.1 hypothetical protein [Winslowiella arboricola]